jgi:hypothetical protein
MVDGFWIDRYAVTNGDFAAFVAATGYVTFAQRALDPARELLALPSGPKQPETSATAAADELRVLPRPCRCCGGRMIIIETFARGCQPKHHPASAAAAIGIDTS